MSIENLEKEIQALDQEARQAMDRLADKREELQSQLEATELAAERQDQREEEHRRAEAEDAKRRAREEAQARYQSLAEARYAAEESFEDLAYKLLETLKRLEEINVDQRSQARRVGLSVQYPIGTTLRDLVERRLGHLLKGWSPILRSGLHPSQGTVPLPEVDPFARNPK